jgi:hypothetical protein
VDEVTIGGIGDHDGHAPATGEAAP